MPAARLLAAFVLALAVAAPGRAQDILVCWGDSIMSGFGTNAAQSTPYGPAPFGDPLPGAFRWDPVAQAWGPMTPTQNLQGVGADPAYGLAAGWRRFRPNVDVYVIALGVSGSDASPNHPNAAASWHPSVATGIFPSFLTDYLLPARQTLPFARIRAIFFTAGNNHLTPSLGADVDDVNAAIQATVPFSFPRYLGVKTYLGTANDPNSILQRDAIDAWAGTATTKHAVETLTIPSRTGGLTDQIHLTHFGTIFLGFWGAVTEFFQL